MPLYLVLSDYASLRYDYEVRQQVARVRKVATPPCSALIVRFVHELRASREVTSQERRAYVHTKKRRTAPARTRPAPTQPFNLDHASISKNPVPVGLALFVTSRVKRV